MKEFFEAQYKMLDRGIVATPKTREDLEYFAKANQGSMDILLMQMAMNFGYKMALENVQEELDKVAQMSEIYNTWKGKEKKVSKTFSPMIGMIYQSNNYIGALVAIEDDVATLQLNNKSLIKVQVQTLKIKIDE